VDEINEEPIQMLSNAKNVSDTPPNKSSKVSHKYLKPSKSSKEIEDKSQDVFEMMKSIQKNRMEREEKNLDEFDVFGDLVSRKLRVLRTRYAQCTVQNLMSNLLYEGEMGKYDEPPQRNNCYPLYDNYHGNTSSASASNVSYSNPPSVQEILEPNPNIDMSDYLQWKNPSQLY